MMRKESKKYVEFIRAYMGEKKVKAMGQKEFFNKDFIKSFKIEKSLEVLGHEVQIVIIPRGVRVAEMGFDGGMLAQPWFYKNDVSRVLVHEEFKDFIVANPELEELNIQMLSHEIGHLISMSNNFENEFDDTEIGDDGVDPREIANIEAWIKRTNIGDLKVADGLTFNNMLDVCKDDVIANANTYIDLRESLAHYMAARFMAFHNKQEIFFTVMGETIDECSRAIFRSMNEATCALLGMARSYIEDDEKWETIKPVIQESFKEKVDAYRSWISNGERNAPNF